MNLRIEGIRETTAGTWAIVGSLPGASAVPGRSPRRLVLAQEFRGWNAERNARRVAAAKNGGHVPPLFDPAAWQREGQWS